MPVLVDDVAMLQLYLRSVLANAKHHANNVEEIVLALAGAIISRKDEKSPLEVHSGRGGGLGNALAVTIKGRRFTLSYNHVSRCIDLKSGSYQGPVLHSFSNATPLSEVSRIFRDL